MIKRVGLFILTNLLVMIAASFLINLIMGVLGIKAGGMSGLLVICLVWGSVGSFISLLISKWMAKKMMNLQIVDSSGPYKDLVRKIELLAEQSGITKAPEVAIYQSNEINAFATGPSKNNSLVAVSTGLLTNMNSEELDGVLAHEISHIANGDMITMALIQGVVNAFVMFLSRIVASIIDNAISGDDDDGEGLGYFAYFIVVSILDLLFGILASPIVMGFSRWREYRADAGSASLVGKEKMIKALEKLKSNIGSLEKRESNIKVMQINSKSSLSLFFSSHPSLENRIQALKNL